MVTQRSVKPCIVGSSPTPTVVCAWPNGRGGRLKPDLLRVRVSPRTALVFVRVVQLAETSDLESEGWRFDSSRGQFIRGQVAVFRGQG